MLISVKVAQEEEIRRLSNKLLTIVAHKDGQMYRENVAKFGIPDEYVRESFSLTSLLAALTAGGRFYIVSREDDIIGFGQIMPRSKKLVELDRIIIFPGNTKRGIGTKLLHHIAREQKTAGIRKIIVRTGTEETNARLFYEKNGFKKTKEVDVDAPWGRKISLVQYELEL